VRLGLNVAVGAVLVALLALAIAHKDTSGGSISLGKPIKTVHTNWDDVTRVESQGPSGFEHGYLETKVTAISFGPHGWRVTASIANKSPLRVRVNSLAAPAGTSSYPHQPVSLLVQVDNGGAVKTLTPFPAEEFTPTLPGALQPFSTWRGTFAGSRPIEHGSLLFVGFGQFALEDPLAQPFSTSTAKSAKVP
jgi:hypothetical protein